MVAPITVHAYRSSWGPYVKDRVSDGMVNQGGTTQSRPLAEFSVKGLFIFGAASIRHE